jgi:hypothetical protein
VLGSLSKLVYKRKVRAMLKWYLRASEIVRDIRKKSSEILRFWDEGSHHILRKQLRSDYDDLKSHWKIKFPDEDVDGLGKLARHIGFGDSEYGGESDYWDILILDLPVIEEDLKRKLLNTLNEDHFLYLSEPESLIVPEEINSISPSFSEIYNQASFAEAANLDKISGVGYRKALEFLIKDYCIVLNPDKEKEIKTTFLGRIIGNFVSDPNIKACAERAAWLGNDETHYVRKWQDKDINDLKELIRLTMQWIKNDIRTRKHIEEMPKKSK